MLSRFFGRRATPPKTPATVEQKPPPILDVTDASFGEAVESSALPVVVDVWAEWCQPCHVMSAYVGFLAKEFDGKLLVTALDADENPQVTERFAIMGLPTLLFLKDGKEVDRIVGVVEYSEIKRAAEVVLATSIEEKNHVND